MKIFSTVFISIFVLQSCSFENEKSPDIGWVNGECLSENFWENLDNEYKVDAIPDKDSILKRKAIILEKEPFPANVIFFPANPKEIVVLDDLYSVRYVYNPKISSNLLDGFSSNLSRREKNRILIRTQELLFNYQCEEGKLGSIKRINYLKSTGQFMEK